MDPEMDGRDGRDGDREPKMQLEGLRREWENEWTDEKHSLYFNSIEASFVKQLHNRKYCLMEMHGRPPRRQKHFRRASTAEELEITQRDEQQHHKLITEVVHLEGQNCGLATSSKHLYPCYSAICHQYFVGSNTEASDQNFVEEVCEGEPLTSSFKKRPRMAADVLSKDQANKIYPHRAEDQQ